MSVLQNIETALANIGFAVGKGKYPDIPEDCGKIIFSGGDGPVKFLGVTTADAETFKVIVRGNNYNALEHKINAVKTALKNAGFIQTGGLEDVESKKGETFMQLAQNFKLIK